MNIKIKKRDGKIVTFKETKVRNVIRKAFLSCDSNIKEKKDKELLESALDSVTEKVVCKVFNASKDGIVLGVEQV